MNEPNIQVGIRCDLDKEGGKKVTIEMKCEGSGRFDIRLAPEAARHLAQMLFACAEQAEEIDKVTVDEILDAAIREDIKH